VAECAGLENQCTFTGTVGSNPTLSAFTLRCNFAAFATVRLVAQICRLLAEQAETFSELASRRVLDK
jgi:hypothetical protein